MDSREVMKRLKDAGFVHISTRGSHHKLRKGATTVIVPHPEKDLKPGTLRSIFRQAGLPWPP